MLRNALFVIVSVSAFYSCSAENDVISENGEMSAASSDRSAPIALNTAQISPDRDPEQMTQPKGHRLEALAETPQANTIEQETRGHHVQRSIERAVEGSFSTFDFRPGPSLLNNGRSVAQPLYRPVAPPPPTLREFLLPREWATLRLPGPKPIVELPRPVVMRHSIEPVFEQPTRSWVEMLTWDEKALLPVLGTTASPLTGFVVWSMDAGRNQRPSARTTKAVTSPPKLLVGEGPLLPDQRRAASTGDIKVANEATTDEPRANQPSATWQLERADLGDAPDYPTAPVLFRLQFELPYLIDDRSSNRARRQELQRWVTPPPN